MKTEIYFWKPKLELFKNELSIIEDYYNRTRKPFNNIEAEVKNYADRFFIDFIGNENTDSSDVAQEAEDQAMILHQLLNRMNQNHLFATILMLYSTWEQQIMNLTVSELRREISPNINRINFDQLCKIFKCYDNNLKTKKEWGKIRELQLLNNTIKHAIGNSAEKLKKIRPDYFESPYLPGVNTLYLFGTVFSAESLQVKEDELFKYISAAMNIWDEMPEQCSADKNEIEKILFNSVK